VQAFARATVAGAQAPELTLERDGEETLTALALGPPGDDSPPLPGDLAYLGDDAGAGAAQALGYQDPETPGEAEPGEKRLYSRSGPGVVAASVFLKRDGAIVIESTGGASLTLAADGSALIATALGSVELDTAGGVTATTPLGTFGAGTHTHSTPFGPSGPPIPGT
jgi:hypothetical protein